jgi:hypothetical protein
VRGNRNSPERRPASGKLRRTQILAGDAGVSDEEIATSIEVSGSRVYRTKRRFVTWTVTCGLGRRKIGDDCLPVVDAGRIELRSSLAGLI